MSSDGAAAWSDDSESTAQSSMLVPAAGNGNANGTEPLPTNSYFRLQLFPKEDHKAEDYDDIGWEFTPLLYRSVERYLPPNLLNAPRKEKFMYIRDLLRRYSTTEERREMMNQKEYRARIASTYQPLHRELYQLNAETFFVPSFLNAFVGNDYNRTENITNIMSEIAPGVYTFNMLQPHFCEMMLAEVENIHNYILESKLPIAPPNTMNKSGIVLDDFGMESVFQKLMQDFISHISKLFFGDVGGFALDSHHGFVVEYGVDKDAELGLHVDDSEVTLNVCLRQQFSGGDLFFRGVRCEKHFNTESLPEEIFEYSHVPGHAIIHRGYNRYGAKATTSGNRVNLMMWCQSAVFRSMRKLSKQVPTWCGECQRERSQKLEQRVAEKMAALLGLNLRNMDLD